MTGLHVLWLPILLSAALVFIGSSILHMVLPWHKADYPQLSNQDKVLDALRSLAIPAGDYMLPRPNDMKDMKSPEFQEKMKRGPVVVMTIMPSGPTSIGKNLAGWFVYSLVVGFFTAYITGRALAPGAPYLRVFQIAGASAFGGYSLALWQMSIWYHRSVGTTTRSTIDGLIYALLTAGAFGWLWPR